MWFGGTWRRAVAVALMLALGSPAAQAGDRDDRDGRGRWEHRDHDRDRGRGWDRDDHRRGHWRDDDDWKRRHHHRRDWEHWNRRPVYGPPPGYYVYRPGKPPPWARRHRDVIVVRPYGNPYRGYGRHRSDDDALAWLGLTAITLAILDNLNESQQRTLEDAQIRATTAPVGSRIVWSDGTASGSVTATREGQRLDGAYCREFQQVVQIGGRAEEAYGTACRQPDGSWMVVDQ